MTPVANAITLGRDKTLDLLLAYGAHIERDSLMLAANSYTDHPAVLRMLLDHGARVNARDDNGDTALILAAEGRSAASLQVLLDRGANVNLKDHAGKTALLAVISSQSYYFGVRQTKEYRTEDIAKGLETVKLLLTRSADVNVRDREGNTALFYVVQFRDEPSAVTIARLLIAKGANVTARDGAGHTLLQLCSLPQLARVLKDAGARE